MKKWLLFLLLLLAGPTAAGAQVAVVAHKSVPTDDIDMRRLLDIYSLEETRWQDGTRIVPFDLKGKNGLKEQFYGFIGRRPEDMKRIWLRLILSGEGRSPTLLKSSEAVLAQVAETPGAIGYVPLTAVTDEVKVIATIQAPPTPPHKTEVHGPS